MKVYGSVIKSYFLKYISTKSFWIYILLLPILTIGILCFAGGEVEQDIQVAVAFAEYGENGEIESRLEEALIEVENITFVIIEEEDIYSGVSKGIYEAGFIFREDLAENVEEVNLKDAVEVIVLESNPYLSFIQESVFQVLYTEVVPEIAEQVLLTREIELSDEEIRESISSYMDSEEKFTIQVEYLEVESSMIEEEQSSILAQSIWKSVVCIYLLLVAVLSAIYVVSRPRNLLAIYIGEMPVKLCTILPLHLGVIVSLIGSMIILQLNVGTSNYQLFEEMLIVLCYEGTLLFGMLSLVEMVKKEWILLLLPYGIIGIVLTHPILWDISKYIPQLSQGLRWLPSYCFFQAGMENGILLIGSMGIWCSLHWINLKKYRMY